jgi:diacylglycerol kinase family enzyme
MHYAFIINYFADKKRLEPAQAEIAKLQSRLPGYVFSHVTEYPGHARELAAQYAERFGPDVLVLSCGGDGTVHEISNALVNTDTPMAVIPLGTGNDFARSTLSAEHYQNPHLIVANIESCSYRRIDMMKVSVFDEKGNELPESNRYSVNITSFGLDTMIQAEAKRIVATHRNSRFYRKNAYTLSIISCLVKGWDYKMKYRVNLVSGETVEDEISYCLACIGNGRYYGKGFNPTPEGNLDDGILEAVIVEDMPLYKVLPLIPKYKKGTLTSHSHVRRYQMNSIRISSPDSSKPLKGNYEGEDFSGATVQIDVAAGALGFAFFSI